MYTENDFKRAIDRYLDTNENEEYAYIYIHDMRKNKKRENILKASNEFNEKYGFRLLDVEIDTMLNTLNEKDGINNFEDFVKEYLGTPSVPNEKINEFPFFSVNSEVPETDFLKLHINGEYRVRLIGVPFKYYDYEGHRIVNLECDEDFSKADHLEKSGFINERYSVWVFDRNDENKLKIMDFDDNILAEFRKENENASPKDGHDWKIKGNGDGTFDCSIISKTELTAGELNLAKTSKLKSRLSEARKETIGLNSISY